MQVQLERSSGMDRRQANQSSTVTGPGRRWYEASFDPMAGVGNEPYDPYDPYWEPMKGQDDD